jgi:hypothetical protein
MKSVAPALFPVPDKPMSERRSNRLEWLSLVAGGRRYTIPENHG